MNKGRIELLLMEQEQNNEQKADDKQVSPAIANAMLCAVFGHRYRLKRRITKNISELFCKRCKKEFGINCSVRSLLPMDDELRELHKDLITAVEIRRSIG